MLEIGNGRSTCSKFEKVHYQLTKKMLERPALSLVSPIYEDMGRPFPFLILDEVQYVKNQLSKTHQAIKQLPYVAVIGASGTILSNQWADMYGLISFLAGQPSYTEHEFARVFAARYGDRVRDLLRARLTQISHGVHGRPSSLYSPHPGAIYTTVHLPFRFDGTIKEAERQKIRGA